MIEGCISSSGEIPLKPALRSFKYVNLYYLYVD